VKEHFKWMAETCFKHTISTVSVIITFRVCSSHMTSFKTCRWFCRRLDFVQDINVFTLKTQNISNLYRNSCWDFPSFHFRVIWVHMIILIFLFINLLEYPLNVDKHYTISFQERTFVRLCYKMIFLSRHKRCQKLCQWFL
jgi:hypothetical protein